MIKFIYLISKLIKKFHIPSIKDSKIDKTAKICSACNIIKISIDRYSYIGNNCTVVDAEIGKFCSIADNCIIGGAGHPIDWVSTSPVFHEGKNILKKNFSEHEFNITKKTHIGNDVWIGNNVLIKSGLKIGNGSIIGMGSVVTKDIGEYEIWAGNPAKFIRMRFDIETINFLKDFKWWNLSNEQLLTHSEFFCDVKKIIMLDKEENIEQIRS